jgi:hypothetical protein
MITDLFLTQAAALLATLQLNCNRTADPGRRRAGVARRLPPHHRGSEHALGEALRRRKRQRLSHLVHELIHCAFHLPKEIQVSPTRTHKAPGTAFIAAIGIAASVNGVVAATAPESVEAENDASRPVIAIEQPSQPGAGHYFGNNLRAQMRAASGAATAPPSGDTISDAFGRPLIAREIACRQTCDSALWIMHNNPTAFAALGTHYPLAPGAGAVAKVDPNNAELHGRGGWNPALVELQANPKPLPWQTRFAKTTSEPTAKLEAKP